MLAPLDDFAQWSTARFQTEAARDRFLGTIADQRSSGVEVEPMLNESRAAVVRWRPGHFLALNDAAYALGGRIIVSGERRRRF